MTREETVKIMRIICDSYPNYKPTNLSETVDVWCMMLSDFTYDEVSIALKAYITSNTSGFAPAISQLIAMIQTITQEQEMNEMEAWALVSKAIRNSVYNSVEEFAKLPPLVQKAVGLPNQLRQWALDENFNEQVASSNFMRCYNAEVKRHYEIARMPSEVRQLIQNMPVSAHKAQIEQKRCETVKISTESKESEIKALEMREEYFSVSEETKKKLDKFMGR